MDDLVGTQAPRRRLVSSAEAVVELERAAPDLASHRRPVPQSVDWRLLEGELGTALPPDYKLLCEHYPSFELSGFMSLSRPVPGNEVAWVRGTHEDLETVAEWCADADLDDPMHPYPGPGGLLPWATSNQGDFFLWTTSPAGPENWTVTVASRSGSWWHYSGGAVQFLADLVSGALESWALPRVRPEITWVRP